MPPNESCATRSASCHRPGRGVQAASERLEYEGLLGRIFKQRFVATADKDSLVAGDRPVPDAIQPAVAPFLAWDQRRRAARARATRGREPRCRPDSRVRWPKAIYEQVTDAYARNPGDPWLAATASEASLALDDCDRAEFWLYRLLHHPEDAAVPCECLRSAAPRDLAGRPGMRGGGSCADRLAGIIARHLMRTEARWSISTAAVREAARAINGNRRRTREELLRRGRLQRGDDPAHARRLLVDRLRHEPDRRAAGHRIPRRTARRSRTRSPRRRYSSPTPTSSATSSRMRSGQPMPASPLNWNRPLRRTGVVLGRRGAVHLAAGQPRRTRQREPRRHGRPARGPARRVSWRWQRLRRSPLIDAKAKAYVVGHPRGSGLQISLHDSLLLDIDDDDCLVHYRTPTDPGSSGSPVFNKQWDVIAVHHSGSAKTPRLHGDGHYEANEGIALSAVRRKLNG